MAALTKDRDTRRREGEGFAFEAGAGIFAGSLVAINADGRAVPATSAGSVCVGVAMNHAATGESVTVRRGVFALADAGDDAALTRADIGSTCYVADDQTVKKANAGTDAVAGVIMDVDSDGVWVRI